MTDFESYVSPFGWRYGTPTMRRLWSENNRRRLWRQLWVALAEAQADYGLLSQEQLADTCGLLSDQLSGNRTVLAEGAQGTLLDLDHGTYPFVSSSTTTAAGALSGLGVGVRPVRRVIGVTKAFQTRAGAGASISNRGRRRACRAPARVRE